MRLVGIALAAAIVAAVACSDSGTSPIAGGLYTLSSVDGAPLPVRGATLVTVRGSLELRADGKYTLLQTDSAITGAALTQFNTSGTWVLSDNAIVLTGGSELFLGLAIGSIDSVRLDFHSHSNTYVKR
jgi:hypothetical protein